MSCRQLYQHCGFLTVFVFALLTVPAQSTPPATTSRTITGRVVNEGGQPVANASITIYPVGSLQQNNGTTTDRDGKFQLSGLEPRSYRVVAWRSPYAPFISSTIYRIGDSLNVTLTKGSVITGTVTSQTGEPVVGAHVHTRMIRGDNIQTGFPYNVFPLERATDDRGVYRLYGLRAGTYIVWTGGGSGGSSPDIDAFDDLVPTYSPASTRDTAAEINVHAGEEVSNVDIRFRGEPGHVISGKATQSNAQPLGFILNLTAVGKNKSEWSMITAQPNDSRGFVFRGVDDGDYDLTALPLSSDGPGGALGKKRIKVSGADVTGIELTLEPLASVSGRIVLEESNKMECAGKQRRSLAEILVSGSQNESQPPEYHPYLAFLLKGPAAVDVNGSVSLKNLVPGRYFFVPEFAAKYWYLQSITLPPVTPGAKTPVDATRTWTMLKAGDRLTGLTITLAQGGASFTGQVADNVSADQFLYLVPTEKERADDALRFFGAPIGSDGKVALNSLPPGSYAVLVKPSGEGERVPTVKLRLPDQKELRASLRREAEAVKTTIELKPCQHLTGFTLKLNQ